MGTARKRAILGSPVPSGLGSATWTFVLTVIFDSSWVRKASESNASKASSWPTKVLHHTAERLKVCPRGDPRPRPPGYQPKLILCPLCRGNPRLKPWATSPGLSKTPSTKQLLLQGCQVLVHELDGDGAFAYGGGAAFDRVEADDAGAER